MKPLKISELTIEQKIGQMLLARTPINEEDKQFVLELLRNKSLGGLHLGCWKKEDIPEYFEAAGYPLIMCENMENGYTKGVSDMPFPLAIGATGDEQLAYEFGRLTAIEAKADGYNLVFGPIVDIAMNPLSCCVGPRAFGGDKDTVARMASAAIRGYQDQGMVVTAKHFPGFGESAVDSHLGMLYLEGDEEQLIERELYPYIYATQNAELSGVMVGHIMVKKVDPIYPASLSPKLIGLLRKVGFNGLIMTDSFAMIGLTNIFGLEECHGLAMAAGNDMVMTSYRIGAKKAYEYMLKAYKDGIVTEEQINAAAARVLAAQEKTLANAKYKKLTQADIELAVKMSEKSMTAHLTGVESAAIPTDKKHLFVIQTGNTFYNKNNGQATNSVITYDPIADMLKKGFPNSDIMFIQEYPDYMQMENVSSRSMDYDSVVMVVYNTTQAYQGSSDLSQRIVALMDALAHKTTAVVLFGNPYAAREFPVVPRLIFAYEGGKCMESAVKVLTGELIPQGKLPVPVMLKG